MARIAVGEKLVRRYAWGVLAYNLAVVAWGALVRATGSGAGCGEHWPSCNGEVIPRSPALTTIIEFTHRATSGIAAISVLLLAVLAFLAFPRGHLARRGAVLSFTFMVTEALLGAGLVLFHLVDKDASPARAVAMSLHLVNTFLLLAALGLTGLWSGQLGPARLRGQGVLAPLMLGAVCLLPLLGVTGAIAALGDTLFPAGSLAQGMAQDFSPAAHFLLRLRIVHPVLAVSTAVLVSLAAWAAAALRPSVAVREAALAVGALFLIQIGAGLMDLALLAPTWMQLVHLLVADLTWLAVVRLAAVALAEPRPEPAARAALAS